MTPVPVRPQPFRTRIIVAGAFVLLTLALLAAPRASAEANGCTLVRADFNEATCHYRAAGPGRYSAALEMTGATIRINGVGRVWLSSSPAVQRGGVPSSDGDLVQVTIRRDCSMICIQPPSVAYLRAHDRN